MGISRPKIPGGIRNTVKLGNTGGELEQVSRVEEGLTIFVANIA